MRFRDRMTTLVHWLQHPRDKAPVDIAQEARLDAVEAKLERLKTRQDVLAERADRAGRALRG